VSETFEALGAPGSQPISASELIEQMQIGDDRAALDLGRPRVIAVMIESLDGRAAVAGRAGGLGGPADRSVLRELRCASDAILVGPTTLIDERYSTLLDPEHRERRSAEARPAAPIAVTFSRRLDPRLAELELFANPEQKIIIYTESEDELEARGADLIVHRSEPGTLSLKQSLEDLRRYFGVNTLVSEGGPTLLHALAAEDLVDDYVITISPLLVAGDAPSVLSGGLFSPALEIELAGIWQSGSFLFLHYRRPR
jgi:riboflavin biosynthesis pyrimidine reductase